MRRLERGAAEGQEAPEQVLAALDLADRRARAREERALDALQEKFRAAVQTPKQEDDLIREWIKRVKGNRDK